MMHPRIIISALRGGSGKTILSIGLIAAWKKMGKVIAPFKKGPDYIDAGWLALAAGRPCYNLDAFLTTETHILSSFLSHTTASEIAVIEGNRGLYDAIDSSGRTSTAELAKLLKAPVILCIDCTKSTRTMAAVVLGCMRFDPEVTIKGVILNRIAGLRHETILQTSIEHHCGVPVLGAIPKLKKQNFPERHMGLVPTPEHAWAQDSIEAARRIVERYIDLRRLARIAQEATSDGFSFSETVFGKTGQQAAAVTGKKPRIGVIKDSAFQFYYPDNIEALVSAGGEVVFFSPLECDAIPDIDALYIGGGFPETHAEQLAGNEAYRNRLKSLAKDGLPIYAECGGLMYLGKALFLDDKTYPMAGILPVVFGFSKRPQGHGYTIMVVEGKNPYFDKGTELKGHEFHYSKVLSWQGDENNLIFKMKRGAGLINGKDGLCYKNVLATYSHIHASGTPSWAKSMVQNAAWFAQSKTTRRPGGLNRTSERI